MVRGFRAITFLIFNDGSLNPTIDMYKVDKKLPNAVTNCDSARNCVHMSKVGFGGRKHLSKVLRTMLAWSDRDRDNNDWCSLRSRKRFDHHDWRTMAACKCSTSCSWPAKPLHFSIMRSKLDRRTRDVPSFISSWRYINWDMRNNVESSISLQDGCSNPKMS